MEEKMILEAGDNTRRLSSFDRQRNAVDTIIHFETGSEFKDKYPNKINMRPDPTIFAWDTGAERIVALGVEHGDPILWFAATVNRDNSEEFLETLIRSISKDFYGVDGYTVSCDELGFTPKVKQMV